MNEIKLGAIITESQQRDAVHVAVVPVVAAHDMFPGQHVGFVGEGKELVGREPKEWIGIVDPFIREAIREGQRFWLFLYPNTITSLRHDWTHPAFSGETPIVPAPNEKDASRAWIEAFAARIDQTYNRVMSAADEWIRDGEYTYDNSETYKDHYGEFPEFWKHYEIVTGEKPEDPATFYTCSC